MILVECETILSSIFSLDPSCELVRYCDGKGVETAGFYEYVFATANDIHLPLSREMPRIMPESGAVCAVGK